MEFYLILYLSFGVEGSWTLLREPYSFIILFTDCTEKFIIFHSSNRLIDRIKFSM